MTDPRSTIGPRELLRLSEKEKEYLETGEAPGSYSQQNIESCVMDTVQNLPARIEILVEDVELLYENVRGTVPFEDWNDCWHEIIGVESQSTPSEVEQAYTYSLSDDTPYPTSGLVEFGETLGRLAGALCHFNSKDEIAEGFIQVILGFVNGFYGLDDGTGSGDYRESYINFVTQELSERSERLAQIDDKIANGEKRQLDRSKKNAEEARKRVEKILSEEDIRPTPNPFWIMEKIEQKHDLSTEESGFTALRFDPDVALFCRRLTAASDALTGRFRQANQEMDAVWRYGIA